MIGVVILVGIGFVIILGYFIQAMFNSDREHEKAKQKHKWKMQKKISNIQTFS